MMLCHNIANNVNKITKIPDTGSNSATEAKSRVDKMSDGG